MDCSFDLRIKIFDSLCLLYDFDSRWIKAWMDGSKYRVSGINKSMKELQRNNSVGIQLQCQVNIYKWKNLHEFIIVGQLLFVQNSIDNVQCASQIADFRICTNIWWSYMIRNLSQLNQFFF